MLVLDANILVRAVIGAKVRQLLLEYAGTVEFFAPASAFSEAKQHIPAILKKRQIAPEPASSAIKLVARLVQPVELETYVSFEQVARARIANRDVEDWPILATALALGCPIWTEDADFFGCGVATWTTGRIHLFLEELAREKRGTK